LPILPLPSGGAAIGGGDLPVSDATDVLAEFPEVHRSIDSAPVRDAFCESFATGFVVYQDVAHRAAAQCDPTRATGDYLTSLALERGVARARGELDEDLRARMFESRGVVSPQAIVDAVNRIIAPYTNIECEFVEPEMDGLFVHDGSVTSWDSFIGTDPRYPDRLYVDETTENGGLFIENNRPGGAVPSQGLLRNFHLRIPSLDAADEDFAFVIDSSDLIMPIGNGSDTSGSESDGSVATSVFFGGQTANELYDTIIGQVEAIKGQGISWSMLVDL
jgi:hypothetical protein